MIVNKHNFCLACCFFSSLFIFLLAKLRTKRKKNNFSFLGNQSKYRTIKLKQFNLLFFFFFFSFSVLHSLSSTRHVITFKNIRVCAFCFCLCSDPIWAELWFLWLSLSLSSSLCSIWNQNRNNRHSKAKNLKKFA